MEIRDLNSFLNKKSTLMISILFCFLLLISPLIIRFMSGNVMVPNGIGYYHAARSTDYLGGNYHMPINLYEILISLLGGSFGILISNLLFPAMFGLFSLILITLISKQNEQSNRNTIINLFVFSSMPFFINIFTHGNQFSFVYFMLLLALYVFKEKNHYWLSLIFFLVLSFMGKFVSSIAIFLIIFYGLIIKDKNKIIYAVAVIVLSQLGQLLIPFTFDIVSYVVTSPIQELISDLGGSFGIGFMQFVLFFFGFILYWIDEKSHYFIKVSLILLFLSIFTFNFMVVFIYALIFVMMIAKSIVHIFDTEWHSVTLQKIALLIIVSSFMFSFISYTDRVVNEGPEPEFIDSLQWAGENLPVDSLYFSAQKYGFLIDFYSGGTSVIDQKIVNQNYLEQINSIFKIHNLKVARKALHELGVDYIIITDEMKSGLVWNSDDDGILFLLRNNETFRNKYISPDKTIEIWEVI